LGTFSLFIPHDTTAWQHCLPTYICLAPPLPNVRISNRYLATH
jgi:hypothetical protein